MAALLLGTMWRGGYFTEPKLVLASLLLLAGSWEIVTAVSLGERRILRSPALWIFTVLTALATASLFWNEAPGRAGLEAALMAGYLAALLVARSQVLRSGGAAAGSLLRWLVYAACFTAVWGIVAYLLRIYPYVVFVDHFLRAGSVFEYSNALSCFQLMALPVTLAFFLTAGKADRPVFAAAAALQIAAVALAFSRLGAAMLLVMLAFFLASAWRRGLAPETFLTMLAGLIMAAAALAFGEAEQGEIGVAVVTLLTVSLYAGQAFAATAKGRPLFNRAFALFAVLGGLTAAVFFAISHRTQVILSSRFIEGLSADRLLPHRQVTWNSAWQAFMDRPAGGWGLGSFYEIFSRYQEAQFTRYAHNVVLQMAVDTGIVGAVLTALFLGYAAALGVWRLFGRFDLMGRALAASALVFIVYNMFDWEWYIPALTAWFMVIVACLEAGERKSGT